MAAGIQAARFAELVKRVLSTKETDVLPDVLEDLFPVFIVGNGAEAPFRLARHERIGAVHTSVAAVVGNHNIHALSPAFVDRHLVHVTGVLLTAGTLVTFQGRLRQNIIQPTGLGFAADARISEVPTSIPRSMALAGGGNAAGAGPGGELFQLNVPGNTSTLLPLDVVLFADKPTLLNAPLTLEVRTQDQNVTTFVTFFFIERNCEPSEARLGG